MRIVCAAITLLLLSGNPAEGANGNPLTLIKDLKILSSAKEIRVVVNTEGELADLPAIEILNDSLLQVDIERSYTEQPRRSFAVGDPFLEKVELYRLDDERVRMRFHLLGPYEEGGDLWSGEDGIVISLKKGAPLAEKGDGVGEKKVEDAFPAIFGGNGRLLDEDYASVGAAEEKKGLNPVVKMTASLALVTGVFLLGAYFFREKLMKKGAMGRGDLIRVLDRGHIDMKKGITIVDVAGEVLVLGTSGESITMLTKLEKEETLERLEPLYGKRGAAFSDAIKRASCDVTGDGPEKVVDRIRKLKPLR